MEELPLLKTINSPADLKRLEVPQLAQLAKEIREYLVTCVSRVGGHLAPSLGVVELTIVLHYLFDTPRDRIVWDVGHQGYVHKILTGRRDLLPTIRQYGGLSGFLRIAESEYDHFGAGHASTGISAALGMACARDYNGEDYHVIAVVGDGALTGGLAFEGLNNAGGLKKDFIVVLNDNRMSISPNVGAIARYLTSLITNPIYNRIKKDIWNLTGRWTDVGNRIRRAVGRIDEGLKSILVPGVLFEELGFRYFGPVDGHNIATLIRVFREVKNLKGPILVHVITVKGKGYKLAEEDQVKFHGLSAFDKTTGAVPKKADAPPAYTDVFGKTLVKIAQRDPKVIGITAAMPTGTGLIHLQKAIPERFYDVGIAEQHAVCFAAGLASQGFKPVAAIYSTFLQRAYDQVIHDVSIQNLPVVFVLDRGGLVGEDGPTHHGVFDLSYLRCIPNMVIMSPKDENELKDMLWTAIQYRRGPIALRYPRGNGVGVPITDEFVTLPIGVSEVVREGKEVALLAIGDLVYSCLAVADLLAKDGISAEVINMRFVKPLDEAQLRRVAKKFKTIITVEDNVLKGGFGSAVAEFFMDNELKDFRFRRIGIPDRFIEHGAKNLLYRDLGLDPQGIARTVKGTLREADVIRRIGFRRWLNLVSNGRPKGEKMEKVE